MIPKIKKILYATDLSEGASHAFGYAIRLALTNDAKISIINVCEKFTNQTNIQMRSEDQDAAKDKLTESIKVKLKQYCEAEKKDDTCQFIKLVENIYVTSGMPVESIIEHATKGSYDLIVMGTHGHGFLYSAVIGSNAQKMVQQSSIPVLVVRLPR
jgi:nucleotide-binding universal stress UspA family protein